MARLKKIQFNVTDEEYEVLKNYSEGKGLSMAEILRDHIKTLRESTQR